MCLAIPMRIVRIDGFSARTEARGVERDVSLLMLYGEDVREGDFVKVHLGHAVEKMTPEEAKAAWDVYDEMLAAGTR